MLPDPHLDNSDRLRLLLLLIVLFALFTVTLASYFRIQISDGPLWKARAERQHFFIVKEPFLRGSILANNEVKKEHLPDTTKLAVDIEKFHLYADPLSLPPKHKEEIASALCNELALSDTQEQQKLSQQLIRKSHSRKLASWLDSHQRDRISSWWTSFAQHHSIAHNALYFVADYQRSHPCGSLVGPLLHTVRQQKEESTLQATPTGGIELYFDSYLRGSLGKRKLMRSPHHAMVTGTVVSPPQHGADVHLTIEPYLQAIAEEELRKGVEKWEAKNGRAVMLDPYTGEIWAIAQYPAFPPQEYQRYYGDPSLQEFTLLKPVCEALEPGSVIKSLTVCAALVANKVLNEKGEEPLFDPHAQVATSNGRFPGRRKPLSDPRLHRYLNMPMAIQKSSNIYMAQLAEKIVKRLGAQWYRDFLESTFAFGLKSGIEYPTENIGMLPALGKRYRNNTLQWSAGTPYSLAIGYNLQVNSIQLVRAYAVLANGGYLVTPTLVKRIIQKESDGTETILLDNTTVSRWQNFPQVLDPEICREVMIAMKYTTKAGGTGTRGDIPGYTEAGKTGTSKKIIAGAYSDTHYRCSFIGIAPATKPAFVLLVTLDEPHFGYVAGIGKIHNGGISAASIFSAIASRALSYLGIPPDDPHGYPPGDRRYDKNKADWATETRNLQALHRQWHEGL